jgi:hypothetical protein
MHILLSRLNCSLAYIYPVNIFVHQLLLFELIESVLDAAIRWNSEM